MGVLSRKAGRVRRQARPVGISILWKPLRDPHYIVASLQPGGGGLRQIFVRQSTLSELQALTRGNPEQAMAGLLLGKRLDCSLNRTPYVSIESHVHVALSSLDERSVAEEIRALVAQVARRRKPLEVLGWFCTSRSRDAAVSPTHTAVHAACFADPWQTILTFANAGKAGAFFLYDARAARWFHAPFYEVTDSKAGSRAPRPTCVAWPAYLTTAIVVPLVTEPVPAPAREQSAGVVRPATRAPRTRAREPLAGVGRAAEAARRSALELAKSLGGRAAKTSREATEKIDRLRAERAAGAARRKAEVDAERAREEERRAQEAAERRAAREEERRQAAELEKRRAAEAKAIRAAREEARRKAAEETERRRAAEAEARRQAREAEVEAQRKADAEAERRRAAEAEAMRQAREAEARRRAEEAEKRRAAEAEARRLAAEETERKAAEEAQRKTEEEARRKAANEEARRKAVEEARRRAAEEEQRRRAAAEDARRKAAEEDQRRVAAAEARRLAEAEAAARRQSEAEADARREAEETEARQFAEAEARRRAREAEARRIAEEAEARRIAEAVEAQRKAEEEAEEERRKAAVAEVLRISVAVAAMREKLARAPAPVEGGKPKASRASTGHLPDLEDTTAADGPYRYLSLARREGFEVTEKIERGSPERPETIWLLHEAASGLRLIVVTTDENVREASLHYNMRTDDGALNGSSTPEHGDGESRTVYGREECLQGLRARCRRLRATGALERDWKVAPTSEDSVSSSL